MGTGLVIVVDIVQSQEQTVRLIPFSPWERRGAWLVVGPRLREPPVFQPWEPPARVLLEPVRHSWALVRRDSEDSHQRAKSHSRRV